MAFSNPSRSSDGLHRNPGSAAVRSLQEDTEPAATEDDVLLERIQQGDQDAMAAVYDRYARIVYAVSLRVLRDPGAAEDVCQDILMQIWRKPESFRSSRGSLASWLAVVARNRSIDVLRRRKPTDEIEDMVLASPYNLAAEAEQTLMLQRARGVMELLPAEQRQALELAFFDGLTHVEVAERTGDPLGTVKTRIRTALLVLRKAMQA